MSYRSTLACLLLYPLACFPDSDSVSPGDWLFIQARLIGCGEMIQNVEVGQVEDSGHVTFFGDISVDAKGQTTQQIAQRVIEAVEKKSGRRPTSVGVVRIPADNPGRATHMMLQIYFQRKSGCGGDVPPREAPELDVPPHEAPELLNDVNRIVRASHNSSLNTDAGDAGAG